MKRDTFALVLVLCGLLATLAIVALVVLVSAQTQEQNAPYNYSQTLGATYYTNNRTLNVYKMPISEVDSNEK